MAAKFTDYSQVPPLTAKQLEIVQSEIKTCKPGETIRIDAMTVMALLKNVNSERSKSIDEQKAVIGMMAFQLSYCRARLVDIGDEHGIGAIDAILDSSAESVLSNLHVNHARQLASLLRKNSSNLFQVRREGVEHAARYLESYAQKLQELEGNNFGYGGKKS